MENKIVIDLEKFKGQSPRDLKTHIEQALSNIKCYVEVPGPNQTTRLKDFRPFRTIDIKTDYEQYRLVDVINEN